MRPEPEPEERRVVMPSDPKPEHPAIREAKQDIRKRQIQRALRESEEQRGRLLMEFGHLKRLLWHVITTRCDGQIQVCTDDLNGNDGRFKVEEVPGGVLFRALQPCAAESVEPA